MGNVLTPMKPCALSGPLPGMAADVVDERVLGLDQHDVENFIERLGDVHTAIAAADDDSGRPRVRVLVHNLPLSSFLSPTS